MTPTDNRAILLGILDLVTALAERLTEEKVFVCLRGAHGYPMPLQPDPSNVRWLSGQAAETFASFAPVGRGGNEKDVTT